MLQLEHPPCDGAHSLLVLPATGVVRGPVSAQTRMKIAISTGTVRSRTRVGHSG
ncbi:hypothetical protein HSR122_3069 [Halapricum desulfuricans]|uniref:Uncharacterized protein n=1 Tax=Halapricum desulfuricans TaxID=2841257 RepID=A0A897NCK8_9EURY|nr:hypothetical protein HSR122_3069 [Halapricum desulfuricans]